MHGLTFDNGKRHHAKIEVAPQRAHTLGVTAHKVLDTTLFNERVLSSLTRDNIQIPGVGSEPGGVPSTFLPGCNILFLAAIHPYQVRAGPGITGVCETDFLGARSASTRLSGR